MIIEILYPEICNLFGDTGNIRYLEKALEGATFVKTHLLDTPKFTQEEVSLVYMGSMSETSQKKVIERLRPYKSELLKCIENGTVMLFTGNACEVLSKYIETHTGEKIEALGVLDFYAKRREFDRYNSCLYGEFEDMTVEGFKSQFSQGFYESDNPQYFMTVQRGLAFNGETTFEGFRVNNLIATYLLGPLLVVNPDFTRWLFDKIGAKDTPLLFEEDMRKAFDIRLKEFKDEKVEMD